MQKVAIGLKLGLRDRKYGVLGLIAAVLLAGCAPQETPRPGTGKRYSVYLTTDDGPLAGSGEVARVVRERHAPLAAFLVGAHARSRMGRALVDRYRHTPGVTLLNHSYSHAWGNYRGYYLHPGKVEADFERNAASLPQDRRWGRLPGRNSWRLGGRKRDDSRQAGLAADRLAAAGYRVYGWDLEWTHTRSGRPVGDAETLYRRIKARLHRGTLFTPGHLVLLVHDQMFRRPESARELERLVAKLQADPEIRLKPLSAYPVASSASAGSRSGRSVSAKKKENARGDTQASAGALEALKERM